MVNAALESHGLILDPAIRNWVLIPITIVMVLVGVLRHQTTILLSGTPKKPTLLALRESKALFRSAILRMNGNFIPPASAKARKDYLKSAFEEGRYLKNPELAGKDSAPPNPMDAAGMDMMREGMKKNIFMIVPQTLIMGWINYFFSGFVLIRLPFPLTLRFKAMLNRGVETADMDVAWVSSLSWYFLNLFGLRGVFNLILGEDNSADGMKDMAAMGGAALAGPGMPAGQPQDMPKLFLAEKENLDLCPHAWELDAVEARVLAKYKNL